MLDATDVLLYNLSLQTLRKEFGMTNAQAGLVAASTLICSAIGGLAAGIISDRIGRGKTLFIRCCSIRWLRAERRRRIRFRNWCSGADSSASDWARNGARGATLVAESWPAKNRGKALAAMQSGWALGYMLAAAITPFVLENYGWRVLFLVGMAPALLTVLNRWKVKEPEVWVQRTETADWRGIFKEFICGARWFDTFGDHGFIRLLGRIFLLPGFLAAPVSEGGAGFTLARTSTWIFIMQAGTFAGYQTFGFWRIGWGGVRHLRFMWLWRRSSRRCTGLLRSCSAQMRRRGCCGWARCWGSLAPDILHCLDRRWRNCIRRRFAAQGRGSRIILVAQ